MSLHAARESLGIPRPQTSDLWSTVFGRSSSTLPSDSRVSLPPLGPVDKNATSTRILLHDTQANLEKFSARVDTLLSGFSEAKSEVKLIKSLFERDRETLINDIIDLVNRCQTQIQEKLGSPAQSSVLDHLSREVCQRLENLDKRLDAIQTLSQTHAQTLQTQVQAIQAIQEQQFTMLAAITPLMPLLQAIPLHIDSAKGSLLDTLRSRTSYNIRATQTSPAPQLSVGCSFNKQPRKMSLSDNPAGLTPSSKRFRIDSVPVAVPQARNNTKTTPKLVSRRHTTRHQSMPRNNVALSHPQTPDPKPRVQVVALTPSRPVATIQHSPGQQQTVLDNGSNAQQITASDNPYTTYIENPFLRHPSAARDMSVVQPLTSKRATLPSVSQNITLNPRGVELSPPVSNQSMFAALTQPTKNLNDLKRTSTQTPVPYSNKAPVRGSQAKGLQLKSAMTLVPSKNGFPPPRRRRSPPKEGRRFIPLLDSDDEDIASP